MTLRSRTAANFVRISSFMPSAKYAFAFSSLRFSNGKIAIDFCGAVAAWLCLSRRISSEADREATLFPELYRPRKKRRIDIFRAFQSFRCEFERPRDHERDGKTNDDRQHD